MASDAPGRSGRVADKLRALRTIPSSVAFSPVGPQVTPSLLGIGMPGHVALTFDDGPDPIATPRVMKALDALGWTATFFLLGEMVRREPGLVRELADAGHDVGLHADLHHSHRLMSPRAIRDDVKRAYATIGDACGDPVFYRPPHGALSLEGFVTARGLGMRTVLWTAWGRDWRADATVDSVCADVAVGRLDGGTVLLHDSDCASAPGSWRTTVAALPHLADVFAARDLVVGPLSDHFAPGRRRKNRRASPSNSLG